MPCRNQQWGLRNNMRVIVVLIFSLITRSITVSEAQSPNVIGTWNVEITFANDEHRSVRFDARADGKGSLVAADPRSRVWDGSKASEAQWNRGEENSITFSGAVEFLLGNVGRDAGTLTFKGKFEAPDSITGEVEFSPLRRRAAVEARHLQSGSGKPIDREPRITRIGLTEHCADKSRWIGLPRRDNAIGKAQISGGKAAFERVDESRRRSFTGTYLATRRGSRTATSSSCVNEIVTALLPLRKPATLITPNFPAVA